MCFCGINRGIETKSYICAVNYRQYMLCVGYIEYIYSFFIYFCLVVECGEGKNTTTVSHSHLNKAHAAYAKVTRAQQSTQLRCFTLIFIPIALL